jgi:hypothetical protein
MVELVYYFYMVCQNADGRSMMTPTSQVSSPKDAALEVWKESVGNRWDEGCKGTLHSWDGDKLKAVPIPKLKVED